MAEYKLDEQLFEPEKIEPTQESQPVRQMVEEQAAQMGGAIGMDICLNDGMVYFGSGDKHVYALREADGQLAWKYLTGGIVATSPELANGVLYVSSLDEHVYALDAKTGELIWKFRTGDKLLASPSYADGIIYIGSFDSHLYAINARTGELVWKFRSGDVIWATAAVLNGKVVFGSIDKRLYCLDAKTGELLWKYLTNGWVSTLALATKEGKGIWNYTDRRNNGKRVPSFVICSDTWSEELFLLDESGSKIWNKRADATLSSQTIHEGKIFAGGRNNYLYCFDFNTGKEIWKFQTGASVVTDPWVDNGIVYFGCLDTYLYALKEDDGTLLWKFKTGGPIITSPSLRNGTLYAGSWDCHLYAIDPKTQEVKWKFRTGEQEGKPVFIKHLNIIDRFKQRIRSFFKPSEAKKLSQYEKEAKPVSNKLGGYGERKIEYENKKDLAYFSGGNQYEKKINLDEEFKKRRENRW